MITDIQITKALRSKATTDLIEGAGKGSGRLILRCKDGRAHWYVRWFEGTQKRFMRIGRYPTTTLQQARTIFNTEYAPKLLEGSKPQKTTAAKGTVGQLFDAYCKALELAGKPSYQDAEKCLRRFSEFVGVDTPANKVDTSHVVSFLRPIYARGSEAMANHLRGYIRSAYNWAIRTANDYRSESPVSFGVKANPADNIPSSPKRARSRYLTADELRAYWNWLSLEKRNNGWKESDETTLKAMKLHIITGQRFVEIARIREGMIDWKENTIEWRKTKNGKPHIIPLPATAIEILKSIQPNEHGFYFATAANPYRPVKNSVASDIVLKYVKKSGCEKFLCRDIRRTWKTLAGSIGISKTDRDLIQNHAKGDVSSVHYDRWEYLPEKRAAMKVWEEWFKNEIEKAP